jgi:hypothetical protein
MSTERKHPEHMEKQIMTEPQEEFVGDEAQPSKDISEVRGKAAKEPPKPVPEEGSKL